jgi:DNA-binding response OmpR family regulator
MAESIETRRFASSDQPRCRLLVIEDDLDIARLIGLHVTVLECDVVCAHDGATGLELALGGWFDLLVLDLGLPQMDGLEVCRRLRARSSYTPILILTARSSDMDRVLGLEMGCDDYLTKPFNIRELVARIKAILRRRDVLAVQMRDMTAGIIQVGTLRIDTSARRVRIEGNPVELTAREFDLLVQFAQNPGRVFTRAQLLDLVWGHAYSGYEHTVNTHINRLRAKIEADAAHPSYILTTWGVGYRFTDELQVRDGFRNA